MGGRSLLSVRSRAIRLAVVLFILGLPAGAAGIGGVRISPMPPDNSYVISYSTSPDGKWLVFETTVPPFTQTREIFSYPLFGTGGARRLSAEPRNGRVLGISPDSRWVVYGDNFRELEVAPIDGSALPRELTSFGGRPVHGVAFVPGSDRVLFWGPMLNAHIELFSVPLDGSAEPQKLSGPMVGDPSSPNGGNVEDDVGGRDGLVLYRADQEVDHVVNLYVVPMDGSLPAVQLNDPPGAGPWQFTADGTRVLYGAQDPDFVVQLYSVPIDGSEAARRLNGTLVPGGDVSSWEQVAGGRVVYLADQDIDTVDELYIVPADGSQAAAKINSPLDPSANDVLRFGVDSQGARVFYMLRTQGTARLFSRPSDLSSAPVRLDRVPGSGRDVVSFGIAPDGSRVTYHADQDSDEVIELYSCPSDGSSTPIKLNHPLVEGAEVHSTAISPDGQVVVYQADGAVAIDVYAVPIDGSSEPLRLNPPMVQGGEVPGGMEFTPDSRRVVFRADVFTDERFLLFSAALDGSGWQIENGPLAAGGDVLDFTILNSNLLVYLADEEVNTRDELYLDFLARPVRHR